MRKKILCAILCKKKWKNGVFCASGLLILTLLQYLKKVANFLQKSVKINIFGIFFKGQKNDYAENPD